MRGPSGREGSGLDVCRRGRRGAREGRPEGTCPGEAGRTVEGWREASGGRNRGRADARDLGADAVEAGARGHVEGAAVGVAPGEVGRQLGCPDRAEVPALGRDDPGAAGTGDVEVALAV